jgi:hypothetical protein
LSCCPDEQICIWDQLKTCRREVNLESGRIYFVGTVSRKSDLPKPGSRSLERNFLEVAALRKHGLLNGVRNLVAGRFEFLRDKLNELFLPGGMCVDPS